MAYMVPCDGTYAKQAGRLVALIKIALLRGAESQRPCLLHGDYWRGNFWISEVRQGTTWMLGGHSK